MRKKGGAVWDSFKLDNWLGPTSKRVCWRRVLECVGALRVTKSSRVLVIASICSFFLSFNRFYTIVILHSTCKRQVVLSDDGSGHHFARCHPLLHEVTEEGRDVDENQQGAGYSQCQHWGLRWTWLDDCHGFIYNQINALVPACSFFLFLYLYFFYSYYLTSFVEVYAGITFQKLRLLVIAKVKDKDLLRQGHVLRLVFGRVRDASSASLAPWFGRLTTVFTDSL